MKTKAIVMAGGFLNRESCVRTGRKGVRLRKAVTARLAGQVITIATVALLSVLAGPAIADTATVTLSIVPSTTQLSVDGLNGPTSLTYTVYATVTGNDTDDSYGTILHGGLQRFTIDQTYTVGGAITGGVIGHRKFPPPPPYALVTHMSPFTAAATNGTLMTPAWVASVTGTGGVDNTSGTQPLVMDKFDYYNDPTRYQLGNGSPVALYTGTIDAKTSIDTTVTINLIPEPGQILVYKVDSGQPPGTHNGTGLYTAVPDEVIGASVAIHVVPEPASLSLLALGGLAVMRRRRIISAGA